MFIVSCMLCNYTDNTTYNKDPSIVLHTLKSEAANAIICHHGLIQT